MRGCRCILFVGKGTIPQLFAIVFKLGSWRGCRCILFVGKGSIAQFIAIVLKLGSSQVVVARLMWQCPPYFADADFAAHASASRQSLRFAHNLDHWFRSVFYGQFSEVHIVFVEDKEICFSNSNSWMQNYYCGELIRCAEM